MTAIMNKISSIFPPVDYSAITFDDLENPLLVAVYSVYWDVSLVLTTTFFCFMLYMMVTKSSREMSDYKWYLIHQLTWSYLFDLYLGLWKPVPLWPFFINYSVGIFSKTTNNNMVTQLLILIVLAVGMGFSVYLSLLHRYMQGSPFSPFYKSYSIVWLRLVIHVIFFVVIQSILCIPLVLSLSPPAELKEELTSKYPALIPIFQLHPSIVGYGASSRQDNFNYFLVIVFVLIAVTISIQILFLNFSRLLKNNEKLLSPKTFKIQLMLFRLLYIQLIISGLMLLFPITLCLILTLFGVRWISSFALLAIATLGMHTMADFMVLCYFVKSYREYIKRLFTRFCRKLGYVCYDRLNPSTCCKATRLLATLQRIVILSFATLTMASIVDQVKAFLPNVNYSDVSFDDLEHPRLIAIYKIIWEISLVVTTAFFCFMLHMIITKSSKDMSDYKWYLVHQLTWSYLFDLYLGLWKPVPLWPFFIGYSAGIFSESDGNAGKTQLIILVVLALGMGFSVYISLFHRYVQGFPLSTFHSWYSVLWLRFLWYIVAFAGLLGILCIPLLWAPPHDLKEPLSKKYPELTDIFELHPSVFGYDTSMITASVGYILSILFILFLVVISIQLFYFNFVRILRRNRSTISTATYIMQHMLFKTLFIQILLAFLMLILPITTCLILAVFGVKWISSVTVFAIAILGMHAMADFLVLIWFIKAYREYVKTLIRKLRLKLGFGVTKSSQFSPGPVSMSALPSFKY
uniref:Serpentine Receptor, class T n=1 Tax=Panagrellus redivivus TaxID=6233 RepID=A0A7E4WB26_PANRE